MAEIQDDDIEYIETIGTIFRKPQFIGQLVITCISLLVFLTMSIGGYWPVICYRINPAFYLVIGAIYTMTFVSVALTASWILVDDTTWLFKACILLFCGLVFLVCGIYYFYDFFHSYDCMISSIPEARTDTVRNRTSRYECYFDGRPKDYNFWPAFCSVVLTFQGVLYLMFLTYLVVSPDE